MNFAAVTHPPLTLQIPLVDLRAQYHALKHEVMAAIEEVLESMHLFLGPNVAAFEDEFAAYCGAREAVGMGSGTDALNLALRVAGVGPGDEVITVSHTFFATAEAIAMLGARAVFVEVDPRTLTLDPSRLEAAITPRTRAIIPVHLYGRMCDMDPIMAVAERHGLVVVEDAAQAHGAEYHGRRAGSIGHLGCFSFYYSKNLGAYGEAGAVVTSDTEMAERLRRLRDHGSSRRYEHTEWGFNARLDEIQAAVLRIKLRHLDAWNDQRRGHAARYTSALSDAPLTLLPDPSDRSHVYHLYVVRVGDRERVREHLADRGVATGVHYPIPVHLQGPVRGLGFAPGDLPVTEAAANEVLSLPMYAELSDEQIDYVAQNLRSALR